MGIEWRLENWPGREIPYWFHFNWELKGEPEMSLILTPDAVSNGYRFEIAQTIDTQLDPNLRAHLHNMMDTTEHDPSPEGLLGENDIDVVGTFYTVEELEDYCTRFKLPIPPYTKEVWTFASDPTNRQQERTFHR